ncbi:diguanylate cyclase [Alphaproteobacteria bacterium]|jgi:uncharacterized membrane protein|nr:diguanylate cyclase [Alphaproteobacteria bacterium]
MDTILIGGFGFLILAGISFILIHFIDKSSIKDRYRRLLNFLVLGLLVMATIIIFKWNSETFILTNI